MFLRPYYGLDSLFFIVHFAKGFKSFESAFNGQGETQQRLNSVSV